ncbi:MAG TPA: hypothetical protein PJ991_02525 [Kiritimatiellia bacterium]|nr:hypothetical protein [Kiritimatiellia bacterium]
MSKILHVVLSHLGESKVRPWLRWRETVCPGQDYLLAFSGGDSEFEELNHEPKIQVPNDRLSTRHHQRERQAYIDVWRKIADWLSTQDHTHVLFMEYDHLPMRADFASIWMDYHLKRDADITGFAVTRVDGTNNPHYLYHDVDHALTRFLQTFTRRADPRVAISMLGTGSLWNREAFLAVANFPETMPVYLELWMPTVAHHLGFRVLDVPEEQKVWVRSRGEFSDRIDAARQAGAWSIHPIKHPPGLPLFAGSR